MYHFIGSRNIINASTIQACIILLYIDLLHTIYTNTRELFSTKSIVLLPGGNCKL